MKIDKNTILFNAMGGFALLMVAAYFIRTTIFPNREPPCSTGQYANLTQLPLEHAGGDLFTSGDLQARLAGRDLGVLDFTKVVRVKTDQIAGPALEVNLPKGSLSPRHPNAAKGGIAFQWRPSRIETASAVCLGYSVWIPADFDFKKGGTLPGLYGAGDAGRDDKTIFAVRYMWREAGKSELLVTLPKDGEVKTANTDQESIQLVPGRWVRLEQEIVLNRPGYRDGSIKVWADGKLVVDKQQAVLRENEAVMFGGVQADAFFGGQDSSFSSPKDTKIRLTPFEVRTR